MSHMAPMNHVNKHMGVGQCMSPAAPMMGSLSPCHIVPSPMGCGPPVGSPINCGPTMGRCSPMGGGGNNANCGPGNSPHTSCNSRQVSRSPLVCTPMSNSPMNVNSGLPMNRSPSSMGSPLGSVMASNVRGNSPLDCGLGINSVGSQKGSPMSVMNSHNMNNISCGSPMGSPSNVSLSNCNNGNMMGSPITSPLNNVPCSLSGGSDLGINLNGVMNRSPMSGPPNSVNSSIMCNSSIKGPSPINSAQMNAQMSMNCNTNAPMVNMGGKSDMNMNELGLRDNCGPPGHMSMKPNNGPLPGSCGMPVNVSCTRPPDISGMQCGPMNSPHCNTMMSNSCGPPMNHGVPCIGNGLSRPQCGPNMGMGMGNPYDGMSPQQCRPNMNRSQFPRGMPNVPYGPPGGMNGPMSGPMNGPLSASISGPNMNNICAPAEMGNIPCAPNSNANGMHCIDSPMNNAQCMSNMNQCPTPNSMFGSQYSPFDVNTSRCSPNLHFSSNEMSVNSNFYARSIASSASSSSCVSNMHPSVMTGGAVTVCTSSNDVLSVTDSIMSTGVSKNDSSTVDSDIASVVCGITSDSADDLNLIGDNLLRESKAEEQRNKPMKEFGGRMLLNDETGDLKDDPLDGKPTKLELVDGKMGDELKLAEAKRDAESDKNESSSALDATTTTMTTNTTSVLTTTTCTTTTSTATTSITTTSVTASSLENSSTTEDGESASATCNVSNKSNENNENEEEYMFKSTNSETHSNASAHSNNGQDGGENTHEESVNEDKIKEEPEEKLLENNFNEEEDKSRDDKSEASTDALSSAKPSEEIGNDKESKGNAVVKMENDDFYDNNLKNKNDCPGGNGLRGSNNGFSGGGMMPGPPSNFNMPNANDVPNMMNSSSIGMNDSLCGSPILPTMNRSPMPNAINHSMSFTNRPIGKVSENMLIICE